MRLIDGVTGATLQLPNDLLWGDEFDWTPIVATSSYTLTGALVVEHGTKQAGRPITLQAPDDMAWVTRSTLQVLRDWASIAGRTFVLAFEYPTDTRQFTVIFDHASQASIGGEPVKEFPSHSNSDWFRVTLKFIEV